MHFEQLPVHPDDAVGKLLHFDDERSRRQVQDQLAGARIEKLPRHAAKSEGAKSKVRMRDQAHEHKARSLGAKWRRMKKVRVRTDTLVNPILAV